MSKFIFVILVISVLGMSYTLYVLEEYNDTLTGWMEQYKLALDAEVDRARRMEEALVRMESKDTARQTQLKQFERRLGSLAADSKEMRDVLSTVIPNELVDGLRAFSSGKRDTNVPVTANSAP